MTVGRVGPTYKCCQKPIFWWFPLFFSPCGGIHRMVVSAEIAGVGCQGGEAVVFADQAAGDQVLGVVGIL